MAWQPLQQAIVSQQQRQQQLHLQWRQLQRIAPQPGATGGLRQLLEKTAAEHGLMVRGITEQQGHGGVTIGWMGHWQLSAGRWQLPLEALPALLGYAQPLEGRGELALVLEDARFDAQQCLALAAKVELRRAQFSLLGQTLTLGEPQLRLRCEPQRLLFALHPPQPPLKLFGEGSVDLRGAYRFSGGLGAMEAVPAQWRQAVEAATRAGTEGKRTIEGTGIWPINLY